MGMIRYLAGVLAVVLVGAQGAAGYNVAGSEWVLSSTTKAQIQHVGQESVSFPITVRFNADFTFSMTDDSGGGLGGGWFQHPDGTIDITLPDEVLEAYVEIFSQGEFADANVVIDEVEINDYDIDAKVKVTEARATLTIDVDIHSQATGSFEDQPGTVNVNITVEARGGKSIRNEYAGSKWQVIYDEQFVLRGQGSVSSGSMDVILGPDEDSGIGDGEFLIIDGDERWQGTYTRNGTKLTIDIAGAEFIDYLIGLSGDALTANDRVDAWHGLDADVTKTKVTGKIVVGTSIKISISAKLKGQVSINHKQRRVRGVWRREGEGTPLL